MMEDRFLENDPAPLFLAGPIDEDEQSGMRKILASEAFRKAVLVLGAAATVFAIVWVVNAILFGHVTASEVARSAPRDSGQSAPAMPSTDSPASNSAQAAAPAGDGLLAAFKAAVESKAETDRPGGETLFNQFKAWATEEEVQAPAPQAEPPQVARAEATQAAREEAVEAARAEIVPLPKRRPIRAEPPARAHDPAPQNAPSLLRQLGWRNY